MKKKYLTRVLLAGCLAVTSFTVLADQRPGNANHDCGELPSHAELKAQLTGVVSTGGNAGLGNHMWGTIVNRDGIVCAVAFSGDDRGSQWEGSRVISAQKANTANAFSLEGTYLIAGAGRALASGNLYGLVQPGGSLFGLQFSNPVDTDVAYRGNARKNGQANDPMVGSKVGGVNVFGGGLAMYNDSGEMVGGLGVSGDTSCTDHIIAWKVRDALTLDNIPGGVADMFTTDNLIIVDPPAPNSFQHPTCGFGEDSIVSDLPTNFPVGS